MRIKNRLSPYPILDNYGDDYINSSFKAEYEVSTQFSEVYGRITFKLENEEIQSLIDNKKAEYLVHIECPSTCFRTKISTVEKEAEFKLNSKDLSKTIEIRTFIVLTENICDFSSKDFHPDYVGQKFNLSAHQIIAIGKAMNYSVENDDKDLDSLPSILKIGKLKDARKGSLAINTDEDKYVMIGLAEEVYGLYGTLGKSTFKATAFTLVLFPALIIILQRMHDYRNDDDFKNRHWFQVINTLLEKNGFKLDDIKLENDSLLSVCQSIFADPIARSFSELESCSERMV